MADLVGQTLTGRYRIEELIGRGGMAEVYKAWDTRRQYHVAIKVMREDLAEDLEFLHRFRREATALAGSAHENIVRFYSFEREGHLAFIVMDFVAGTTLRRRILEAEGAPLSLDEVLSVTQQVCAALHYAHEEGVIHRDVKPGNILIQPDGRVLLSDFGIAKAVDAATTTTVMPGTPAYMSPEQCRSERLDVRTDIYSLGVVVYEMLTGQRPFVGEVAPETMTGSTRERIHWEQMHAAPPPLRRFNPALPHQIEEVVLKALAKERKERWPSALAFWRALEGALGAVMAEAVPVPEPVVATPAAAKMERAGPEPQFAPSVPFAEQAVPAAAPPTERRIAGWALVWMVVALIVVGGAIALLAGGGLMMLYSRQPTATLVFATPLRSSTATVAPTSTPRPPAATPVPSATPRRPTATLAPTATPHPKTTPTETPQPTSMPGCPAVSGPFAVVWSSVQGEISCATGNAVNGLIVEEIFEGGKMFWHEPIDHAQALVLFLTGTWRIFAHSPYIEGSPEFSCVDANTPAQCPPTPKRGFGMMWCDIPEIRNCLGDALDCERGYQGWMQQFDRGFMLQTDSGTIYVFYSNGRWEYR